jgi:hypothetical protein
LCQQGQGVHHFGIQVEDFDRAKHEMVEQGFMSVESGIAGQGTCFAMFDTRAAIGSYIELVYLDEDNRALFERINGEEWSRSSSASLTWKIKELIAYASKGETVWPGEVLGSGTVGTGSGAEHGKKLHPGDIVELEVQGIGVLRNRIGIPGPRGWEPEPRKSLSQ